MSRQSGGGADSGGKGMDPLGQRSGWGERTQLAPAAAAGGCFSIRREKRGGELAIEQGGGRGLEAFRDLQQGQYRRPAGGLRLGSGQHSGKRFGFGLQPSENSFGLARPIDRRGFPL